MTNTRDVSPAHEALVQLLAGSYGVRATLAMRLARLFVGFSRRRGQALMREGENDRDLYFVERGLLRVFFRDPRGKEFNKAFVHENMFFVALSAYLQGTPLRFSVEALEPTRGLRIPYAEFADYVEREPQLAKLWRRYMEAHFVRHEAREATLQLEDAAGRYRWFLHQHAALVERVPLYHVASYLGTTNVTLSRVRARRARDVRS